MSSKKVIKKSIDRCIECRCKISLIDRELRCKCGGVYCIKHRFSVDHSCKYDFSENDNNNNKLLSNKIIMLKVDSI
jgi:hypothetical protein